MNYNLIVLDFDGTIADTRSSILVTVKETLNMLGMELKNNRDAEIIKLIGLPLKDTFQKIAGLEGEKLEKATKVYRELYDDIALKTVSLFDGVKETLTFLHNKGVKLSIASSKGKKSLVALLETLGIANLMDCIIGEQDVANKKPAPDSVNFILSKLNISPKKTLVVGDMIYDIKMGQNADCATCGVTYGNGTIEEFKALKPTYVINQFSELSKIFLEKSLTL